MAMSRSSSASSVPATSTPTSAAPAGATSPPPAASSATRRRPPDTRATEYPARLARRLPSLHPPPPPLRPRIRLADRGRLHTRPPAWPRLAAPAALPPGRRPGDHRPRLRPPLVLPVARPTRPRIEPPVPHLRPRAVRRRAYADHRLPPLAHPHLFLGDRPLQPGLLHPRAGLRG